jgi:Luciferase-like monooxygenase
MLEIGVRLPDEIASVGEWLAEAQALEAAGAGWLWLGSSDGGRAHWPLLGGLSVVTRSCRLGLIASASEARGTAELARHAVTLDAMTRGRFALAVPASASWNALTTNLKQAEGDVALLHAVDELPPASRPPRALLLSARPAEDVEALVSRLPEPKAEAASWTIWVETVLAPNRLEWKQVLADYERAGAAGLIVTHDPRLLDMLRNPDLEDDRADLQLAQG